MACIIVAIKIAAIDVEKRLLYYSRQAIFSIIIITQLYNYNNFSEQVLVKKKYLNSQISMHAFMIMVPSAIRNNLMHFVQYPKRR